MGNITGAPGEYGLVTFDCGRRAAYVNGIRVPGRRDGPVWDVGLDLNMADISAVEVYPRPAVLPIEYNGLGVCAVTLVWPGWSRAVLPSRRTFPRVPGSIIRLRTTASSAPRRPPHAPPSSMAPSPDGNATNAPRSSAERTPGKDFIRTIVERHLEEGTYDGVVTRFPPEPNGYLHIGHAKSICLNFGLAQEYGGRCHLRYDDTNPLTEEEAYARSMREDVRWLGFDWGEHLYYASDYFEKLYEYAVVLIEKGLAYVDSQSEEEIRAARGSVTEPGTKSPYRERSVEENLDLFRRMRAGEFEDGEHVLRAKIDMAHPNMIMRDPVFYRILHAEHYRTGDDWCIYPLYDFAHCLEDAIEDITHSTCTLEFDNNREIYDWILDHVGFEEPRPHQYEFARLNLEYTVLSKRKLIRLVREGHVEGWDDPRMPTIAGMRRRGIPPEAIRTLSEMAGVTKVESRLDFGKLEYAIRDALNPVAPRVLAVLRPLKVVLENVPEDHDETLEGDYYPRDIDREGTRPLPFGREIWIERGDFSDDPPKGWKRLAPGRSVRLRHGYVITLDDDASKVVRDDDGEVVELRCRIHPDSLGRNPDDVKVSGVLHWVAQREALSCTVRLVDRLFGVPNPDLVPEGKDFTHNLNPESMEVVEGAVIEPSVAGDDPETRYQFERIGYFRRDPELSGGPGSSSGPGPSGEPAPSRGEGPSSAPGSSTDALVFNRIVSLRDSWSARRAAEAAKEEERDDLPGPRAEGVVPEGRAKTIAGGGDAAIAGTAANGDAPAAAAGPRDRISDERRAARDADPALRARFERYQGELGLSLDDADVLTASHEAADFFEEALEGAGYGSTERADVGEATGNVSAETSEATDAATGGVSAETSAEGGGGHGDHEVAEAVAAWVVNEVRREVKDRPIAELPFSGRDVGRLVRMVLDDRVSRIAAKEVFEAMVAEGARPEEVVRARGLEKVRDAAVLEPIVERLLDDHPGKVEAYRDGKTGLAGFFVGQVMRETGGSADPKLAKEIIERRLQEDG